LSPAGDKLAGVSPPGESVWPKFLSLGWWTGRGGITKPGNALAQRALIEGAWTYRLQARVSCKLHKRNEKLPQAIRGIAWKAQLRLYARYRPNS
jgi:transposase